jgi:hypothetical protein
MLADGFFPAVTAESDAGVVFAASATDGLYVLEWSFPGASVQGHPAGPQN